MYLPLRSTPKLKLFAFACRLNDAVDPGPKNLGMYSFILPNASPAIAACCIASTSIPLTDVENVRQTWWHQVIKENGWRLCINNSYSGATVSYSGYDGNDYRDRSFNTRMDNLGQPDVIFVFGATNDSWAGSPVGEYKYENINFGDLYSFRPALARMLQWMTDRYINTEIYFILNDDLRDEIDESVKTICQHYGVPVIELEKIDKMSGHPSVKGMRQIADQVNRFLKENAK